VLWLPRRAFRRTYSPRISPKGTQRLPSNFTSCIAPINAAVLIDHSKVAALDLADRAICRGWTAVCSGLAKLDLGIGYTGAVLLSAAIAAAIPNAPTNTNEAVQCWNMTTLPVRCWREILPWSIIVRSAARAFRCLAKYFFRRRGGPAAPAMILLPFATRYKRHSQPAPSSMRSFASLATHSDRDLKAPVVNASQRVVVVSAPTTKEMSEWIEKLRTSEYARRFAENRIEVSARGPHGD
jgi:hypothetical protein